MRIECVQRYCIAFWRAEFLFKSKKHKVPPLTKGHVIKCNFNFYSNAVTSESPLDSSHQSGENLLLCLNYVNGKMQVISHPRSLTQLVRSKNEPSEEKYFKGLCERVITQNC